MTTNKNEQEKEILKEKTSKEHIVTFPKIKKSMKEIDQGTADIISMGHLNNILSFDNGGRPTKKRARN